MSSSSMSKPSESPIQDTFLIVYLIMMSLGLPCLLITLRCFSFKNVPKCEIFRLWGSLSTWGWIIFYIVFCWYRVFCESSDCFFGGIKDRTLAAVTILISLCSFTVMLIEPMYAWSYYMCDGSSQSQPLPIQLEPDDEWTVKDLISRIEATGPTLVAGAVEQTEEIRTSRYTTRYWDLIGMEQFQYLSWSNDATPYFDPTNSSFKSLEEVFNSETPILVKASVEISPANEETSKEYFDWSYDTGNRIMRAHREISQNPAKSFLEEVVSDNLVMQDDHKPSRIVPSVQLPSLVSQKSKSDDSTINLDHCMIARNRLIVDILPCWINEPMYGLATLLLLAPVYRVCYWLTIKDVKFKFKKTFNTNTDFQPPEGVKVYPYQNNIEEFVPQRFS